MPSKSRIMESNDSARSEFFSSFVKELPSRGLRVTEHATRNRHWKLCITTAHIEARKENAIHLCEGYSSTACSTAKYRPEQGQNVGSECRKLDPERLMEQRHGPDGFRIRGARFVDVS
ncbi:hypothetical protein KM043_012459 [Ampulex compressa]|nr:hypothetical protein KM043_012459 [Ampulex compressa]